MTPIRLLLVDDHVLFRQSLARLLASEPGFEVAGECVSVDEALDVLRQTDPDVILLDFELAGDRGDRVLAGARRLRPGAKILVVTAGMTSAQYAAVLRLGASGIFLKHGSPATLVQAIRLVADGSVWVEHDIVRQVASLGGADEAADRSRFTERERRVLHGVFEGLANKEIGTQLGISESSVKSTLQQLFRKTRVRTRSQLVRIALEDSLAELKRVP